MNNYYVYIHKIKNTNRVFYVGKGHGNRAWEICGRNPYWNHITNKHQHTVEIVKNNLDEASAYSLEKQLIAEYGKAQDGGILVNLTDGGEGRSGFSWNGDRAGNQNPMHGRSHRDETKTKISQRKKDKPRPAGLMEQLAVLNRQRPKELHGRYGKKHTEQAKHKMSLAGKGKRKTVSTILDTMTGIYYIGWQEVADVLGLKVHQVEHKRRNNKLVNYIIT